MFKFYHQIKKISYYITIIGRLWKTFSTFSPIVDKNRNELDPERVRMLMFLYKNLD